MTGLTQQIQLTLGRLQTFPSSRKLLRGSLLVNLFIYIVVSNLLPVTQSGFRKAIPPRSSYSASLSYSVYGAIDGSQLTLLAMLDVSATFDTESFSSGSKYQSVCLAISLNAGLFLNERYLSVVHGPTNYLWVLALYGLSRGSVLGPLFYIIYTSDLGSFPLHTPSSASCTLTMSRPTCIA